MIARFVRRDGRRRAGGHFEFFVTRASGVETPKDRDHGDGNTSTEVAAPATKASIGRWFKRVGDPVSLDEPLVEIETDGTTVEVTAPATGVLSDILLRDGEGVKADTLLGTITEYGSGTKTPGAR